MSLSEAMLLDYVRQRLFSPTSSSNPRAIGAELELIPVDVRTRAVTPAAVSAPIISELAIREEWLGDLTRKDETLWNFRDGASISFEPGGQIEISSSPHETASSLIESLQRRARLLQAEMDQHGITLIARGVDPYNDVASVPLQLQRDRYIRMTDYFNSVGTSGARMMRQTAALQINVEKGSEPEVRWRLLNAIAPVVTALFANSGRYAGADTGYASYRAHLWSTLDPSRTGLAYARNDPAHHYLTFALDAVAIRSRDLLEGRDYQSFRSWMQEEELLLDEWEFHLSTLFPEVRPKAYFELRSADTVDVEWLAAPIVFVTGLIYDEQSERAAAVLLGEPDPALMEQAAKYGLSDARLKELAGELTQLSIQGAYALGPHYLEAGHIESAREYFARRLARD